MNHHSGVLAGLHDLIQIADGPDPDGTGQGAVVPHGLIAFQQIASDQIGCKKILMTGNRDQGASQAPGHVFHKAGLAASGGAFEHHREPRRVRCLKQSDLIASLKVKGFVFCQSGIRLCLICHQIFPSAPPCTGATNVLYFQVIVKLASFPVHNLRLRKPFRMQPRFSADLKRILPCQSPQGRPGNYPALASILNLAGGVLLSATLTALPFGA